MSSFPIGSVIIIDNFRGKDGTTKKRWFVYLGFYKTLEGHIICTTTSRVGYYTDGKRKNIPHTIFEPRCFQVRSVLDVMGVYYPNEEEFKSYNPRKVCELSEEELKMALEVLLISDYVEEIIKDYLRELLKNFD
ncbi:MAG: hypothetical protein DSZ31_00795 [Gammaproteobacteria bacterium]|nr:MAG: hypothetical protein DSZ31_00795 [Gammaproteobacteria bacterium]